MRRRRIWELVRAVVLIVAALVLACGGEEDRPRPRPRPRPAHLDKAPPAADAGASKADAATDAAPEPDANVAAAARFEKGVAARKLLASARRLANEKQPDAAIAALEQARDALPDDGGIRLELAAACLEAGNRECAQAEARAAIDAAPDVGFAQARAWELLGRVHEASAAAGEALTAYEKALRLQPTPETAARLGALQKAAGGASERGAAACPLAGPASVRAIEVAEGSPEARGKLLCPLLAEPFIERDGGGFPIETHVVAALSKSSEAGDVLRSSAGLGAESSFALLLVRLERDQASVVTLDSGARPGRDHEVVRELTSEVRRVTLGPSRPGLAVEVVTRGWWDVGRGLTPFGFERHELYLAGRQLNRWGKLASQVTLERGHKAVDDCVRGPWSRPVDRRGVIWLEDLDLSGVPEICREATDLVDPAAIWHEGSRERARTEAECLSWVASALAKSRLPVPSLQLDEFDQERSINSILEVSRVPEPIRAFVKTDLGDSVILAARALEAVKSGMRALAVVADEDSIDAMALAGDDATTMVDLGDIGVWRELWAEIDATDPALIAIEVTARGDDLGGAAVRRWLHLIATGPGEPPRLALSEELMVESPAAAAPCPSVVSAQVEHETKQAVLFLSFKRQRRTGPGVLAVEKTRQVGCDAFAAWLQAGPDAPLPAAVGPLQPAEAICPSRVEEVETIRYAQGADRRLVRTTTVIE